jgi:hypothetical protein
VRSLDGQIPRDLALLHVHAVYVADGHANVSAVRNGSALAPNVSAARRVLVSMPRRGPRRQKGRRLLPVQPTAPLPMSIEPFSL